MFAGTDDFIQYHEAIIFYCSDDQTISTNMSHMFSGARCIEKIKFVGSGKQFATNTSSMFETCRSLLNVDMTGLNTSHVTDMSSMFADCTWLSPIDLSALDTSHVTDMSSMFASCTNLSSIDLSPLDTSQVTNISSMFADCGGLLSIDLSTIDTSNVTDMSAMLKGCSGLATMDLSAIDTSSVQNMSSLFAKCTGLSSINLVGANTSQVTNMSSMFEGCTGLYSIDLSVIDTSQVTDMSSMLKGCTELSSMDLSAVDTSSVQNMSSLLAECTGLLSINLVGANTSQVTNMSLMFEGCTGLSSINLSGIDTSSVTNMSQMFAKCTQLPKIDISSLDTSKVDNMSAMFSLCFSLTTLDLTGINTTNVRDMTELFAGDSALKKLDISALDMSNVQFQAGHYSPSTLFKAYWLFNFVAALGSEYDMDLTTIKVNRTTKLSLPKIEATKVSDLVDPMVADGTTLEELLDLFKQNGINIADLSSAGLRDSQGYDKLWINNETGETLTSAQLMARYDGNNPLATDATWTWQNILGQDKQVISGKNSTWTPSDSLAGLIDTSKTIADLTTTITDTATNQTLTSAEVNALLQQPTHAGQYHVAYQYIDSDGTKQVSAPVTLSLLANQSVLTTKDSVIQLGATWTAADNIAALLDADGTASDLTKVSGVVSVNGVVGATVDTTVPGVYQVSYQMTDSTGILRTATATVIVNGLTLNQARVDVSTDDHWDPVTNVALAIDDFGKAAVVALTITANGVEVNNLKKLGTYQISYHFTDDHGEHVQTAIVNVKAGTNYAGLTVKDSSVYQFGTWNSAANFISAVDSDGEQLDMSAVTVIGTVAIDTVGSYVIEYQFTDQFGTLQSKTATVTVLKNQANISAINNNGILYAGGEWKPNSIVVTAKDVDGSDVEADKIQVTGAVDMSETGNYDLTYSFTDRLGHLQSYAVTVAVLENQASIKVKNNSDKLYVGGTWNPSDMVVTAKDVDGSDVEADKIQVTGAVGMSETGNYQLTYSFTDRLGHSQSQAVTVTVLENQASIKVKNNGDNLYADGTWNPSDIAVIAKDIDGSDIEADKIQVTGTVDMGKAGDYDLNYSFTDRLGHLQSQMLTITVLENQGSIVVTNKSGQLYADGTWNPSDMVVTAKDVDGSDVEADKIQVTGAVDISKAGNYDLTYSFTDRLGHLQSYAVTVSVLENQASIEVTNKSDKLYADGTWNPTDIKVTAKDVDGSTVPADSIQVTGVVDMSKAGDYQLTYSFTDRLGHSQSQAVTVTVLENQASIEVKNNGEKLFARGTWNPADIEVTAKDVAGSDVEADKIQVTGAVDMSKAGNYDLTYSFMDSLGHLQSKTVTVTVLENQASIAATNKSGKLYAGGKWNPTNIEVTAKDVDGGNVEVKDIKIDGTVDMTSVGNNLLTYYFVDSLNHKHTDSVNIIVLKNQAEIKVNMDRESFRVGATWSAKDNLISAIDVDGSDVDLKNVQVESTVNPQIVGKYEVTYSFTDQQGKLQKVVVPVEVLANMASIQVKAANESFRVGATWSAKDNLISATDVDGSAVDLKNVQIDDTVNPQVVGQYEVTYSFTDQQGKVQKVVIPVEVLANMASIQIKATNESFRIGATWSTKDNLISATDVDGSAIDLSKVQINSTVKLQTVGQYEVTCSFTDQQGNLQKVVVPVEVLANLALIQVKSANESFRVGATWSAKNNLISATNVDGTPVNLASVEINSTVDAKNAGKYEVTCSFTDQQGNLQKVVVPVEVLANMASLQVKPTNKKFRTGATWSAKDNLISATDVDGSAVDLKNVQVESTVNLQAVGKYGVTYSFTDQQGKLQKVVVPVEVLANMASIQVKSVNESFRVGATWSAKDNLISATNVDGTTVDLASVEINSTVDAKNAGEYEVMYSFTDQQGKLQKVVVPVEVLANLAAIQVKSVNESFRVGATWSAKDNLISATDVDGSAVDLSKVQINSTVNPQAVGQYEVTYSFTDQQGKRQEVTVPVNVLANYANLNLYQTEISFRAGDNSWQPETNVALVTDVDGSVIAAGALQITNTVDATTPGTYQVSYAFTDQLGKAHIATTTVTVLENLATLLTKQDHVTLYLGNQQWQPEDNLELARNVDGSTVATEQLQFIGDADLTTVGDYELTYQFVDQLGRTQSVQFTVTVAQNRATIVVKQTDVVLRVGDTWEPMQNLVNATDIDGSTVAYVRIIVNVTKLNQRARLMMMMQSRALPVVDTTTVGSYNVSYQFTDGNGNLQELVTTVNVLPNEASLKLGATDVTCYVGDQWQAVTNVVTATNVDGTPVTANQLSITGSVNTQVTGQYRVLYRFIDQQNKVQEAVATVTVLTNQAKIQLNQGQLTLTVGDQWQPLTNLKLACDVNGQAIDPSDIVVTGNVDTNIPGSYQVNYSFTDQQGHQQLAVATVTVVAPTVNDQSALRLQADQVTLRAGAVWNPRSNVAQVRDVDGSLRTADQVSVQGTVALDIVGKYLLTYHFTDQLGHDHTASVTVIVLANEASLQLRATAVTLKVGQTWDATANILAATDVDGQSVDQAVTITSNVDWQQPGTYQVTYSFVDQQGKTHSAMTNLTLMAAGNGNTDNGSGNQDGNGSTDNGSGNQGSNGNTDNGSGNQGGNGSTDNGSGNQGGSGSTDNGSGNQGGNGSTDNGSGNQGGNGSTDNGSGNQSGNGSTDNGSSNQGGTSTTDKGTSTNVNQQPDIVNSDAKRVAAKRSTGTAINHHDNDTASSTMARTDSRDLVTTDTVKSTETPRIGTPTQLPQTDEQTPATANWWGWLGLALTGLIAMIKPNKNKQD